MISGYPQLTKAQEALDSGHYREAAQLALAHVRSNPRDPRGLGLLGNVASRMGALGQGEQFLRKALALAPESPMIISELASCLHQQERLDEAYDLFTQVENDEHGGSKITLLMCLILDKLGRTDEARAKLEKLSVEEPRNSNCWLAYGLNLRAAGRTNEAIQAYRNAAEIDPERGDAWWGMASIKSAVFTEEDIATMEQSVRVARDVINLSPLHFALGRAKHQRKDYEAAFRHYSEGNRLWAESLNYAPEELSSEIRETEHLFDRDYFSRSEEGGVSSNAPIFIVSLPRSGSTLLEQILGSHKAIEPLGELPHVPAMLRSVMEFATRRGVGTVPQALLSLTPSECRRLGDDYLRRAALHRKTDSPHFTDKLPHNWSNVLFIRRILPNAKIIDIRRNPVDCCFSNFTHSFSRAHASSFALEDIGRTYVDYVRLMDHLDQASPGLIHHVGYERLVEQPESELRAILDYLGLPWDEACLRFHESKRTVRTPSAEQVRRPLNRSGMGVWKPYEQWLGPLFDALGPLAGQQSTESAGA